MILILTSPEDPHLPFVTKHLKKDEYIVIDVGVIAEGAKLTYEVSNDTFKIKYEGKELKEITGVWYRRPRTAQKDLHINVRPDYLDYAYSALQQHVNQLYALLENALWISDVYAVRRAENKVFQLLTAKKVGFQIPEVIFTSDAKAAEAFVNKHRTAIVKPESNHWPKPLHKDTQPAIYARKVSANDQVKYAGLHMAPSIFQQLIDPDFELRITVIGNAVFAAKVLASDFTVEEVRDWRLAHTDGKLDFEEYNLPDAIAKKCIRLTKELGLNFGAIDMIRAKDGTMWFLEINPNGQWGFIEWATKQPLGKTMAQLLRSGTDK